MARNPDKQWLFLFKLCEKNTENKCRNSRKASDFIFPNPNPNYPLSNSFTSSIFFFFLLKKKLNLFIYSSPKSNLFIIIYIYIYTHTAFWFQVFFAIQISGSDSSLHLRVFNNLGFFFFSPKFSFSFFALKIFICMIYLLGLIYQIGLRWRRSCWSPVLLPVLWFQQRGSRNQRASLWFKSEFCCKFSHSSQKKKKKKSEFW